MPRDWPQSKVLRLVVGKQEEIINIVTVLYCFLFESTEEKAQGASRCWVQVVDMGFAE